MSSFIESSTVKYVCYIYEGQSLEPEIKSLASLTLNEAEREAQILAGDRPHTRRIELWTGGELVRNGLPGGWSRDPASGARPA
jgi:hypothetical protein